MAKLGPIHGKVQLTLDGSTVPIDVATFEVPLRTSSDIKLGDTTPTVEVHVDRTALRDNLREVHRAIADRLEADFSGEPTGQVILTCADCGAQLATTTLAELRHNDDGSHTLDT